MYLYRRIMRLLSGEYCPTSWTYIYYLRVRSFCQWLQAPFPRWNYHQQWLRILIFGGERFLFVFWFWSTVKDALWISHLFLLLLHVCVLIGLRSVPNQWLSTHVWVPALPLATHVPCWGGREAPGLGSRLDCFCGPLSFYLLFVGSRPVNVSSCALCTHHTAP